MRSWDGGATPEIVGRRWGCRLVRSWDVDAGAAGVMRSWDVDGTAGVRCWRGTRLRYVVGQPVVGTSTAGRDRSNGEFCQNSRRELVRIDVPAGALAGMLLEVLLLMSGPSHS